MECCFTLFSPANIQNSLVNTHVSLQAEMLIFGCYLVVLRHDHITRTGDIVYDSSHIRFLYLEIFICTRQQIANVRITCQDQQNYV